MAVINPYNPGTPVPLPTYTGAPGDWSAMMKWKPWESLDRYQDPTFNPQWLPDLAPWILPEETPAPDIPIIPVVEDEWVDPDAGGNGINGVNGNGTTGTDTGIDTGIDTGVDTGTAIDQGLLDAQAAAAAQALADEQAAAQVLADQQAADALAVQQAADAKAAADTLLEQQRLEDERIRQEQEAAAAVQALEDAAYGRVSTAKDEWGRDHWEASGKSEGRDLPGDFGDYVESYSDLADAYLEHRKSLKVEEEETASPSVAPVWMRKPDGTWGWINPLTFQEQTYAWSDPNASGGIAHTGISGTQLAGASGYPRWEPYNPYATITPGSTGTVWINESLGFPRTYQQWLDQY